MPCRRDRRHAELDRRHLIQPSDMRREIADSSIGIGTLGFSSGQRGARSERRRSGSANKDPGRRTAEPGRRAAKLPFQGVEPDEQALSQIRAARSPICGTASWIAELWRQVGRGVKLGRRGPSQITSP